jgi:2-octaprenyl-6-methoxyphenol hydroxylase
MQERDVIVVGGGQVGLTLAVAIAGAAPGLRVALQDARPLAAAAGDVRASAIAAAGRRMFQRLGVWPAVAAEAEPIRAMVITDSPLAAVVRPTYLTFEAEAGATDGDGAVFAHMVPNAALAGALATAAAAVGVEILPPATVAGLEPAPPAGGLTRLALAGGGALAGRLVVAADGARSRLRGLAGLKSVALDYDQAGIVTTVVHDVPHEGRAYEHFLPAGPFATLPLADDGDGRHRSSIVWTESRADADRLVGGDDLVFAEELARRFGTELGRVAPVGARRAFPLGLMLARDWVAPGFALAGDAAHFIHPIAGQGLNLGLRDAAALAEVVVEAARLGLDIGRLDVLERYQRWRRFDTVEMGVTTDVLDRLFSNDVAVVRSLRTFGLGLVDRLPGLKSRLIGAAAGLGGRAPRLLAGEAI